MTTLTPDHLDAGSGDGPAEQLSAVPPSGSAPISPELVLVDPELAQQVRATAPDGEHGSLLELDGGPGHRTAVPRADHYERLGDELRLFQESSREEGFVWRHDDAAVRGPTRRPEAGRPHEARVPPRRRKRVVRVAAFVVAAIVLGGAGAALGDLFASSPDAASTDSGLRGGSEPSSRSSTAASDPTTRPKTDGEGGTPRIMAWAPAPGAAAYEVALYAGSRRIFLERTKQTRLALPEEWSFGGRRLRLEPGVYRWYVWPVRAGARKASARPVVQATLTIPAS
jgi:hypothetical protein